MMEYCMRAHGDAGIPTTTTSAPEDPSRGWESLASEYDLQDMMDMENNTNPVLPTVDEEFITYTTAPLSPKSINIVKFWEVSHAIPSITLY